MAELVEEYDERLRSQDPDALEASRDWSDFDGTPWQIEAGMGAVAIVVVLLVGVVLLLVGFFTLVQDLTGG